MPNELSDLLRKGLTPSQVTPQAGSVNSDVAALQKQVQDLTLLVQSLQGTKQEVTTTPIHRGNGKTYVSYRELADVMDDPKALATLLNSALAEIAEQKTTITADTEKIQETLLSKLSTTLDDRIAITVTTNGAIADFYHEHPEFVPFKYQAGVIVSELQAENPNWSIDQLLNKTEEVMVEKHGAIIDAAKSVSVKSKEAGKEEKAAGVKKVPTQPVDGVVTTVTEEEPNPIAAMVARYRGPESEAAAA